MTSIVAQAFVTLTEDPLILVNIAIAVINSANKAPIAARDDANFAESINDMTTIAAANIAIAPAILIRASALSLV